MARRAIPEDVNLLDLVVCRAARWEEDGERVVVLRDPPERRGALGVARWVAWRMAPRRIRLDPVGSTAWRRIDGRSRVGEIAEAVRTAHGDAAEPVEERVGRFVRLLREEGLVDLVGWDGAPGSST